jgi:hypothetical protein
MLLGCSNEETKHSTSQVKPIPIRKVAQHVSTRGWYKTSSGGGPWLPAATPAKECSDPKNTQQLQHQCCQNLLAAAPSAPPPFFGPGHRQRPSHSRPARAGWLSSADAGASSMHSKPWVANRRRAASGEGCVRGVRAHEIPGAPACFCSSLQHARCAGCCYPCLPPPGCVAAAPLPRHSLCLSPFVPCPTCTQQQI